MTTLLIISNTAHYIRDGLVVGHGPTVLEIDYLAQLFDSVRHVACIHKDDAPPMTLAYQAHNVDLVPVPPSGGITLRHKLSGIWLVPKYSRVLLQELLRADAVHVRAPSNIPMLALFWLALLPFPRARWLKYAGSWRVTPETSRLSRLQRWWLFHDLSRGIVTVNGNWPNQPAHVHEFFNPCLTDEELKDGYWIGRSKSLTQPLRLIFVGRISEAKGAGEALQVTQRLKENGVAVFLDLIGDGPERPKFERLAYQLGLARVTHFWGQLPRSALPPHYAAAHFLLLPSQTEGWPKVISEAMAYGAIPISNAVGSIGQYLEQFHVGHAIAVDEPTKVVEAYIKTILAYLQHPSRWQSESMRAMAAAQVFSYSRYQEEVRSIFHMFT